MKLSIFHDTRDRQGGYIFNYIKERSIDSPYTPTFYDLNSTPIEPCCGCFGCWLKTPGICIYKDKGAQYLKGMVQSDRILILCPVTWGGCSSRVKILLDRSLGRVLPFFVTRQGETHHSARYESGAQIFLAGYGDDVDSKEEALFLTNGANISDNMGGGQNCVILRSEKDWPQLDIFWGGQK